MHVPYLPKNTMLSCHYILFIFLLKRREPDVRRTPSSRLETFSLAIKNGFRIFGSAKLALRQVIIFFHVQHAFARGYRC